MKKSILIVCAIISMSAACAGPRASGPYISVSGAGGEILRAHENGKMVWKASRDEVARVMIGLLLQKDKQLKELTDELATLKAKKLKKAGK